MGRMAQWPSAIAMLAYITMLLPPPMLQSLLQLLRLHPLPRQHRFPHQLPPRIVMP